MSASSNSVIKVMSAIVKYMHVLFSSIPTIVFHHPYIVSVVLRSHIRFFSHSLILSTNIYVLVFPWLLAISAN